MNAEGVKGCFANDHFTFQNVVLFNVEDPENTYYEQYNTCVGLVKTGDFIYVATDGGRQQIAQVDLIWSTKELV